MNRPSKGSLVGPTMDVTIMVGLSVGIDVGTGVGRRERQTLSAFVGHGSGRRGCPGCWP